MSEHHCPFLNRKDDRCAEHFSVGRMQHAFDHCFSSYASCPTYREMLEERTIRRDAAAELVPMTIGGHAIETRADVVASDTAPEGKPRNSRPRRPRRAA